MNEPKEISDLIRALRQEDEALEQDRCVYYSVIQQLKDKKIYGNDDSPIAVPSFILECDGCNGYWNECPYYVVGE